MNDNYILRAFLDAPRTILGGLFLFVLASAVGQALALFAHIDPLDFGNNSYYVPDPLELFVSMCITYALGMLSGFGFIFLGIEFWFIYRLMYQEESTHAFFFVIAASQFGLAMIVAIIAGHVEEVWPGAILALIFWAFLYWVTRKIKIRIMNYLQRERDYSPKGAN